MHEELDPRIDYHQLAKDMKTHYFNAIRCWEAWVYSRGSNFPVPERGFSPYNNRIDAFRRDTGVTLGAATRYANALGRLEQQLDPQVTQEGSPWLHEQTRRRGR